MSLDTQPIQTITVDGVAHQISSFSESVQRLTQIHTAWRTDLIKERLAVSKTETAVRALEAELTQLVQSELAAKAAPADTPTDTPAAE